MSELAAISLSSVAFVQGGARFSLSKPRKAQHTGPLQSLFIPSFADHEYCPVDSLKEYVRRTTSLRKGGENSSLFISVIAPHAEVTSNTLSRWVKNQLGLAGVDTNFSAHSTRGAAASAAAAKGASIDDILKAPAFAGPGRQLSIHSIDGRCGNPLHPQYFRQIAATRDHYVDYKVTLRVET